MSEKRFALDSDFVKVTSQVAWDNQEEKGLTLMKLVDLLNTQQATIERLEKENKELGKNFDDLVKWATTIAKRNVLLDEKIGQLQQAIKRAYEEKPYPKIEDIQAKVKSIK